MRNDVRSTPFGAFVLAAIASLALACNTFEEPLSYAGPGSEDGGQTSLDGGIEDGGTIDTDGGTGADASMEPDLGTDAGAADGGDAGGPTSWQPSGPFGFPTVSLEGDPTSCSIAALPDGSFLTPNLSLESVMQQGQERLVTSYFASDESFRVTTWSRGDTDVETIHETSVLFPGSARADAASIADQWLAAAVDRTERVTLIRCSFAGEDAVCEEVRTEVAASHVAVGVVGSQFRVYTLFEDTEDEETELNEYKVSQDGFALEDRKNRLIFATPQIEGVGYISAGYIGAGTLMLAALAPATRDTGRYEFLRITPGTLQWIHDGSATQAEPVTTNLPKVAFFNSTSTVWGAVEQSDQLQSVELYTFSDDGSGQWDGTSGLLENVKGFATTPVEGGYVEVFLEPTRLKVVAVVGGSNNDLLDLTLDGTRDYFSPVEAAVIEELPVLGLRSANGGLVLLPICFDETP